MTVDPLLASVHPGRAEDAELEPWIDAALASKKPTLVFIAPEQVDLSAEEELPLLALQADRTDAKYFVRSKGVLIATRLEGNVTQAATWTAWKEPAARPARAGAGKSPKARVGFGVDPFRVDLRERIPDLIWRPGTLLVRLVLGGTITAAARVELSSGVGADDPDVRTYVDWAQAQQAPQVIDGPSPMPMDRHRDEWTPELPAATGIALNLQRVSLTRAEDQLLLRGSFRLPLRPAELIPLGSPFAADAEGRAVVARLRITLVLVGDDFTEPAVISLPFAIAHLAPDLPDGRPCAVGEFRCNLFGHPAMPRMLQRYSLFAFSGEYAAGPLPLTLISETLVPPREDLG